MVSKVDLLPGEEAEALVAELGERLGKAVLAVSSATGTGIDELRGALFAAVPVEPAAPAVSSPGPQFEAEHAVYRPEGDGGFAVERENKAFRVTGRGVEMLVARHDLSNLEALGYLEQRLREIGVIAALERAGFEPGGEVRIGDEEFELD